MSNSLPERDLTPPPTSGDRAVDRRGFLAVMGGGFTVLLAARLLGLPAMLNGVARGERSAAATPLKLRFLTDDPSFVDTRPCFSPAGDEILFMRAPPDEDPVATLHSNQSPWSLWTVPTEGGSPSPLFEHPRIRATRPDWSWTTGWIAFSGVREGRGELWLLDPADGTLERVAVPERHRGRLFYPSWYPDGKSLAVTDYRRNQVLRVEVGTGAAEPLTDPSRVRAGMCSVSPDKEAGSPVAFAGQIPEGPYRARENSIWLRTGAGRVHQLLSGRGRMPWWSPDGERLAFMSTRPRPAPAPALHPRELPDGIPSIFTSTVTLASATKPDLEDVVGVSPLDHWTTFPRWAPDGRKLVCRAMSLPAGRSGITILDLGGRHSH